MKKIYYSPSGNRRIYVEIGKIPFTRNGMTVMEPETVKCQFGATLPGRFETDDERVQAALEKHPSFNRDFILFEGEAAKLLANAKTLIEVAPGAKEQQERAQLVKEAKTLGLRIDPIKATNTELKDAIERHKLDLQAKTEVLVTPAEVPEAPQVREVAGLPEAGKIEPTVVIKKRGRPKAEARI